MVISVAQISTVGIHDVSNGDVGSNAHGCEDVVEVHHGVRVIGITAASNLVEAVGRVNILPDTPVAVDKCVVHKENGITRRRRHVRHDGTNTIVAITMRSRRVIRMMGARVDGFKGH